MVCSLPKLNSKTVLNFLVIGLFVVFFFNLVLLQKSDKPAFKN